MKTGGENNEMNTGWYLKTSRILQQLLTSRLPGSERAGLLSTAPGTAACLSPDAVFTANI